LLRKPCLSAATSQIRRQVVLEDYADDALDTAYTYDDPAVPFSKGRLTRIARSGSEVAYGYDRFGRLTQDGELSYAWDKNGNRAEIGYPGSVTARYTHDFADREASLEIQVGAAAPQTLASAATYKPFGPLAGLTFGNGLAESRGYTSRYLPQSIQVPGRLEQTYSTDAVGNILGIERPVGTVQWSSAFGYQDPQYFLTQGTGPWGHLEWTYDRIGNRLSEGAPDADEFFSYSYVANASGSNTPKLASIAPAPGGEPGSHQDFGYDDAGNQTTAATLSAEGSPGRASLLDYSGESRLARMGTSDSSTATDLLYDGRGMLRRSSATTPGSTDFSETDPLYSSEGLLLARRVQSQTTHGGGGDEETPPVTDVADETTYLFYFAGRPITQLRRSASPPDPDRLLYLATDHLGTPVLATDELGETAWEGGLDPFGTPYAFPEPPPSDDQPSCTGDDCPAAASVSAASATADSAGIFLRFPGQWDDPSFGSSGLRGGIYYNVYRWYETGTGRYIRPDPVNLGSLENVGRSSEIGIGPEQAYYLSMLRAENPKFEHAFGYSAQNPIVFGDPFGLFGPGALAMAGGACAAADGPIPVGDIIGVPLVIGAGLWGLGIVIADAWDNFNHCEECKTRDICTRLLELCLTNPSQPEWNRPLYGPRKDCGACFRRCKHNDGEWPFDMCPLP
jgi:RHS repeat-associated protein